MEKEKSSDIKDFLLDAKNERLAHDFMSWAGHFRAASLLIDQCESDPVLTHWLIFPIIYCYRYGLEAAMKGMIRQYGYGIIKRPPTSQNLPKIWPVLKDLIETYVSSAEPHVPDVEKDVTFLQSLAPTAKSIRLNGEDVSTRAGS